MRAHEQIVQQVACQQVVPVVLLQIVVYLLQHTVRYHVAVLPLVLLPQVRDALRWVALYHRLLKHPPREGLHPRQVVVPGLYGVVLVQIDVVQEGIHQPLVKLVRIAHVAPLLADPPHQHTLVAHIARHRLLAHVVLRLLLLQIAFVLLAGILPPYIYYIVALRHPGIPPSLQFFPYPPANALGIFPLGTLTLDLRKLPVQLHPLALQATLLRVERVEGNHDVLPPAHHRFPVFLGTCQAVDFRKINFFIHFLV